ncbi:hypothetical protein [Bordetella sp. H567]|uniref:hypothetical protein n=1 Tax=Bordetella sp. H567 TaxID=1697043 RepID=UPI00082DC3E0|nr:hypothetical protein [Bordetella sp. H567]
MLNAVDPAPSPVPGAPVDGMANLKARMAAIMDRYVREGAAGEKRAEARRRVEAALAQRGATKLNLSNLNLRQAPPLLPDVVELDLSKNRLTRLPTLPCGIQTLILAQNQFETLPAFLPGKLQRLDVSYNSLSALPETLPAGLISIDATRNALQSLPSTLPLGLVALYVGENRGPKLTLSASSNFALRDGQLVFSSLHSSPGALIVRAQATVEDERCHTEYHAYLTRILSAEEQGSRPPQRQAAAGA